MPSMHHRTGIFADCALEPPPARARRRDAPASERQARTRRLRNPSAPAGRPREWGIRPLLAGARTRARSVDGFEASRCGSRLETARCCHLGECAGSRRSHRAESPPRCGGAGNGDRGLPRRARGPSPAHPRAGDAAAPCFATSAPSALPATSVRRPHGHPPTRQPRRAKFVRVLRAAATPRTAATAEPVGSGARWPGACATLLVWLAAAQLHPACNPSRTSAGGFAE